MKRIAALLLWIFCFICLHLALVLSCDNWRYRFRPVQNSSLLAPPQTASSELRQLRFSTAPGFGSTECAAACGRMFHCRAFAFCPKDDCVLYWNWGPPFPPSGCQLPVMRKLVARFESCIERWVGNRRFCLMQQRISGSVSFVRSWTEYENGFGDADNFWIGLKTFRSLTPATVRFELTKFNGSQYHCEYDGFTIGDEASKYTMDYSRYASERSNIATDSLHERNRGMKFSTTDQDNDALSSECSNTYGGGGGWWFGACFRANPNGEYSNTEVWKQTKYLNWYYIDGDFVSLRETRIMVQLDG